MAWLLLIGGLLVAALAAFNWSAFRRLPTHAARTRLVGTGPARAVVTGGGLAIAAAGVLMLLVA